MDELNQTGSQSITQTMPGVIPQTAQQINSTLDAASLAADAIAKASGIASLEQAASVITALESRLKVVEGALPEVLTLFGEIKNVIPQSFVTRVEDFFARHFPMHAAPNEAQKPE